MRLLDLHAGAGREKAWVSYRDYERQAGLELVTNRIEMTAELDSSVIVLHVPKKPDDEGEGDFVARLFKSLDEIESTARDCSVRIAIENMGHDDFVLIEQIFAHYSPDYVGLCYDSGHGCLESNMHNQAIQDEAEFLRQAFEAGKAVSRIISDAAEVAGG